MAHLILPNISLDPKVTLTETFVFNVQEKKIFIPLNIINTWKEKNNPSFKQANSVNFRPPPLKFVLRGIISSR